MAFYANVSCQLEGKLASMLLPTDWILRQAGIGTGSIVEKKNKIYGLNKKENLQLLHMIGK